MLYYCFPLETRTVKFLSLYVIDYFQIRFVAENQIEACIHYIYTYVTDIDNVNFI